MKKIFFFVVTILVFQGCKTTKEEDYKQQSTGPINSLSVVISNEMWNGKVGDKIRSYFAAPMEGLATEEPIFSIHQMPPSVFTDFARMSRNVLVIQKSDKDVAGISEDLYAKPQQVAIINGTSEEKIIELLDTNAPKMVANFKDHEIIESQRRMVTSKSKEEALLKEFGITLKLPSTYIITTQDTKFFWIRRQIQKYEGGILVYEVPYDSVPSDENNYYFATKHNKEYNFDKDFTVETPDVALANYVVSMRDSIGKAHVPGRDPERMYMQTEKGFAPSIHKVEIDNRKAIESRGLWEMKNFLMGGPYINYMIPDKANNRYIVIDGFVFAPSIDKRDYIFELESIAKSIKFKEDADFDLEKYDVDKKK
ncbi:DUF4837 domain-containing protein [Neptunitalea chrysea]|uniref:DUF4837 domain-containing protein n=1 Tax=Neptunitalea chrysea TaxID=1647581 RepID=A0A9W6B6V6_9FLAO|nr:DUF4837 family protein [Neptunitalea chrysea]GLB52907.1 DUF4837 domain-containing protein [Neptunitalea chrysea]